MFTMGTASTIALVVLAFLRSAHPALSFPITILMALILAGAAAGLLYFGKRYRWLPSRAAIQSLSARLPIPGLRQRHV